MREFKIKHGIYYFKHLNLFGFKYTKDVRNLKEIIIENYLNENTRDIKRLVINNYTEFVYTLQIG